MYNSRWFFCFTKRQIHLQKILVEWYPHVEAMSNRLHRHNWTIYFIARSYNRKVMIEDISNLVYDSLILEQDVTNNFVLLPRTESHINISVNSYLHQTCLFKYLYFSFTYITSTGIPKKFKICLCLNEHVYRNTFK